MRNPDSSYLHWGGWEPAAAEILRRAHDLVAFGWCQDVDARDASYRPVQPWSSQACYWSLLGALVAALDAPRGARLESPQLIAELRLALEALSETMTAWSLKDWNDDGGRTQGEVLDTLTAAQRRCLTSHATTDPDGC